MTMKAAAALFASLVASAAFAQTATVDYRFDTVRRTVTLTENGADAPAKSGMNARSGDVVHTGWFAYALISSSGQRAKFEIFSNTDVTLTDGSAGVILTVNRGRIRAAFDKITGSEPRVVKTPGALLAVRGTQFDVQVDAAGNTTVDVFEGLVEVQSHLRPEPFFVRPGEETRFGPQRMPQVRPMPEDRQRNGPQPRHEGEQRDGQQPGQPDPRPRDGGAPRPPNGGAPPQAPPSHGGQGGPGGPGGPGGAPPPPPH
jgi:hypothetical protein